MASSSGRGSVIVIENEDAATVAADAKFAIEPRFIFSCVKGRRIYLSARKFCLIRKARFHWIVQKIKKLNKE